MYSTFNSGKTSDVRASTFFASAITCENKKRTAA